MSIIELEDVTVRFGELTAVDSVSFTVGRGERLMIVGTSGSGKTTTLETINRLVEPTRGVVRVFGEDSRERDIAELRRSIGYHFQGVGLFPHMSVARNIATTPRLLGWSSDRIARRVDALLAMVDLEPKRYRDRMPAALSGGQRQRVGVARALAAEPEIVLFDEPFGALDPLTREALQAEVHALVEQLGTTIVFVTHDVSEALRLGTRIAVMHEGALLQIDAPETLRSAPVDDFVASLIGAPERALQPIDGAPR